jgi:ribosomal protein S18 acetylase RimI-like enzyme
MREVLVEARGHVPDSRVIHLGDLNWWLYYILPSRGFDLATIAWLWEEGGQPIGFLLVTPDEALFDLFVHPAIHGTPGHAAMLAWSVESAARLSAPFGPAPLGTDWVFEDDDATARLLETLGFARNGEQVEDYMIRELAGVPDSTLPDGFRFSAMNSEALLPSRSEAHRLAFSPGSRMNNARYAAFRSAPDYRPELDVIILDHEQRVAAFAMCWVDRQNRIAEFEPVGVHPDFQRQGLGHAVLYEGMRRMRDAGADRALVYVARAGHPELQAFYRRAGFTPRNGIASYRQKAP